jgi:hypothetical protein
MMNEYTLLLGAFLAFGGPASGIGTISGMTASQPTSVVGQAVRYNITSSGGSACGLRLVYGGGEPADNVLMNSQPGSGAYIDKVFTKAGTYNLRAVGSSSMDPKCSGQASISIVVQEAATRASAPASSHVGAKAGVGIVASRF